MRAKFGITQKNRNAYVSGFKIKCRKKGEDNDYYW